MYESRLLTIRVALCNEASLEVGLVRFDIFDGYNETAVDDVRAFGYLFFNDELPCSSAYERLNFFELSLVRFFAVGARVTRMKDFGDEYFSVSFVAFRFR